MRMTRAQQLKAEREAADAAKEAERKRKEDRMTGRDKEVGVATSDRTNAM